MPHNINMQLLPLNHVFSLRIGGQGLSILFPHHGMHRIKLFKKQKSIDCKEHLFQVFFNVNVPLRIICIMCDHRIVRTALAYRSMRTTFNKGHLSVVHSRLALKHTGTFTLPIKKGCSTLRKY